MITTGQTPRNRIRLTEPRKHFFNLMRRSDFIYTAILPPVDYAMIMAAGILAYELRKTEFVQRLDIVSDVFYQLPTQTYLAVIAVVALVWILFFSITGLYNERETRVFINQITKVFTACTAGMSAVVLFLFFRREFLFSSRFIILAAWIMSIVFVLSMRALVRIIRRILLRFHISAVPIVVVGGDTNTNHFIEQIAARTRWGYRVVARAFTLEQLEEKVKQHKAGEVILADLRYSREKINDFLNFCQTHHVNFRYAADIFSANIRNMEVDTIAEFPFIELKRTPLEGWGRIAKRMLDVVGSLIAIGISFIPGIVIALLIKLTSPGNVFVALPRLGEGGVPFKIYKFRSMVLNAHMLKSELLKRNERRGVLFKMKDDPRITRVGKFLRRWSLDELPNFYNVLIGTMSLVGPRPHEPEEVKAYTEYQRKLLNIKPGITGLAQISGRSNLSFEEEARLDIFYVENWSLKMDFAIMLKTPGAVLFRREGAM